MQKTRLVQLLETLDRKEIRELRKFVRSPFVNQRADVVALFEYLTECLWTHQVVPDKAQAYRKVYRGDAYDDHRIRLAISFLFKATEQFLVYRSLFSEEVKIRTRLAQVYRKRNLQKHFERTLREAQRKQKESPFRNADYYNDQYQLLLEEYQNNSGRQRISEHNLQDVSDNLDIAYVTLKLRQICLSISHQTVYKKKYHFGLLAELLGYVKEQELLDIPAIAVYYYCYFALSNPGEAVYFQEFKKLIFEHADIFPKPEVRDLYLLAINYCVKQYNEGNPGYLKDQLELLQMGLEKSLLLSNGIVSRFTYRNAVTAGLILREYDWVETFVNQYQANLEKDYRESMYSFCLARLEYSRKNYDRALQLLQKSEYKDLLLNLSAKTVMLENILRTG